MKRIQSRAGTLKHRVGAVHSRAKFVGMIYLFATLALLAAAVILPLMSGTVLYASNTMPVVVFANEFKAVLDLGIGNIFQTPMAIIVLLQLILYAIMLLVMLINVLRCLAKLNWLFKKKASYVNGFNRNMYAMDALGKRFSSSFSALVTYNVLFMVLTARGDGLALPKITMLGYITLGVALLIRFGIGALEGSVPLFTTGGKIVEKKRDHRVITYFIRNLVQVAALAGMLYFLASASNFVVILENMLTEIILGGNKLYLIHVDTFPMYVELIAIIFLMVMIKHATASTEYNRACNHTSGRHNFAIFSCMTAVLCGVLILFPYIGIGLADGDTAELNMSMLWMSIIALCAFLFDAFFRARDKKRVEAETNEDPVPGDEEEEKKQTQEETAATATPVEEQPVPTIPTMPNMPYGMPYPMQFFYPYNVPTAECAGEQAQPQAQMPYQPIFVPVFCPFPQQNGMMYPFQPVQQPAPAPAPAPENLLPAPSPMTAEAEAKEAQPQGTVEDETLNPNRKYKVSCPHCGKVLMAKDNTPYHRCPACDKVFKLRKFKTYVKSE